MTVTTDMTPEQKAAFTAALAGCEASRHRAAADIGAAMVTDHDKKQAARGNHSNTGRPAMKKQGKSPFATVRLLSASAITPQPIEWLWDGHLARGKFHIVAGPPGTGKTTIAMALAATVSIGGRWPDGSRAEAGNVLIWSGEDDPRDTLVPRLMAHGANRNCIKFVGDVGSGEHQIPFDPAQHMPELARATESIEGGIAMIIVDPVVSSIVGDSHKNTEVRRGLQPLVYLAARLNCALIGITHFSKGTAGRDPLERVTGSIAFGALARVVLATSKIKDETGKDSQILVRAKSNIGPDSGGFYYDFAQTEVANGVFASTVKWGEAVEGKACDLLAPPMADEDGSKKKALDQAKEFLIAELKDGPVFTKQIKAAAQIAGVSWAAVRRAKEALELRAEKEPDRTGRWFWALPSCPEGLQPGQSLESTDFEDAQIEGAQTFEDAQAMSIFKPTASAACGEDAQGAQDTQRGRESSDGGEHPKNVSILSAFSETRTASTFEDAHSLSIFKMDEHLQTSPPFATPDQNIDSDISDDYQEWADCCDGLEGDL